MSRDRAHRHDESTALTAFLGALAVVALVVVAVAAPHARFDRPGYVAVFAASAALFKFAPLGPLHTRPVQAFTLMEIPVVLGVATLPAADAIVAAGIGAVVVLLGWPRCWHKAVYNAAEVVVGTAVAVAVANPTTVRTPGSVVLLALAGMSYAVVSTGLLHAVLVVGYDESQQRFLVRNSWGKQWGMGGYFTMPYAYLLDSNLSDDFWTIRLTE